MLTIFLSSFSCLMLIFHCCFSLSSALRFILKGCHLSLIYPISSSHSRGWIRPLIRDQKGWISDSCRLDATVELLSAAFWWEHARLLQFEKWVRLRVKQLLFPHNTRGRLWRRQNPPASVCTQKRMWASCADRLLTSDSWNSWKW